MWDAKHLRIAADAAGVALWLWNVDTCFVSVRRVAFHNPRLITPA